MQTGKIRSYSKEKRYGFILGDDGESYFFHKNHVKDPGQGIENHKLVEFDAKPTPKGMAAFQVSVSEPVGYLYSAPDTRELIFSKSRECGKGNKAVYIGNAFTCEAKDPEDAKKALIQAARDAGYNAVLSVERGRRTHSGPFDGNYKYSVHSYTAVAALVKKVTPSMDAQAVTASNDALESEIQPLVGTNIKSSYYGSEAHIALWAIGAGILFVLLINLID